MKNTRRRLNFASASHFTVSSAKLSCFFLFLSINFFLFCIKYKKEKVLEIQNYGKCIFFCKILDQKSNQVGAEVQEK